MVASDPDEERWREVLQQPGSNDVLGMLAAEALEEMRKTMQNDATNRYEALGMPEPDPATMCPDECEGTGWLPVKADDPDYAADWAEAEAKAPTDDGWHFVHCHTCGGTGKRLDARKE